MTRAIEPPAETLRDELAAAVEAFNAASSPEESVNAFREIECLRVRLEMAEKGAL